MKPHLDAALADSGLDHEAIAASIARVYGLVVGMTEPGDPRGWLASVQAAESVIGGDDEREVTLSMPDFAATLRGAYGYAVDPDYEPQPAASLSPFVVMGWEAVARHLVNVWAMDGAEARKLATHEAQVADFVRSRHPTPEAKT